MPSTTPNTPRPGAPVLGVIGPSLEDPRPRYTYRQIRVDITVHSVTVAVVECKPRHDTWHQVTDLLYLKHYSRFALDHAPADVLQPAILLACQPPFGDSGPGEDMLPEG